MKDLSVLQAPLRVFCHGVRLSSPRSGKPPPWVSQPSLPPLALGEGTNSELCRVM
jgi:hypothetical protein